MVPNLRQEQILKYMENKDVILLKELAEFLGASLSTVRRDIQVLERNGAVRTMRGGAVRTIKEDYDAPVARKEIMNIEAKEIIARKAAALVQDGDYIYIDSGTTTVAMLKYLTGKSITVVTSSTQLLEYLPIKGIKYILLGGEIKADLKSTLGALTEKLIESLYFDKAFIGANGYVVDDSIYTYDPREAKKKELVKNNSREVYVLMDTSKKNKRAFTKVFDFNECILIDES